jgi:hypothetical protein
MTSVSVEVSVIEPGKPEKRSPVLLRPAQIDSFTHDAAIEDLFSGLSLPLIDRSRFTIEGVDRGRHSLVARLWKVE